MKLRFGSACLLALALVLGTGGPASAQPGDASVAKAKELFDAGAREYENGRFDLAIQAFEQAYKIAPRDGIVFSMAQAHRRQFTRSSDPAHLARAGHRDRAQREDHRHPGRKAAVGRGDPLTCGAPGGRSCITSAAAPG